MTVVETAMPAEVTSRIDAAVEAIAGGEMVILVDSPQRENEGDLVIAGEHVTPQAINFMATHGRGMICTPMLPERLERVPPETASNAENIHDL